MILNELTTEENPVVEVVAQIDITEERGSLDALGRLPVGRPVATMALVRRAKKGKYGFWFLVYGVRTETTDGPLVSVSHVHTSQESFAGKIAAAAAFESQLPRHLRGKTAFGNLEWAPRDGLAYLPAVRPTSGWLALDAAEWRAEDVHFAHPNQAIPLGSRLIGNVPCYVWETAPGEIVAQPKSAFSL